VEAAPGLSWPRKIERRIKTIFRISNIEDRLRISVTG
jgi:hypothetical protein